MQYPEQIREGGSNQSYVNKRESEIKLIKTLLEKGYEPIWKSKNNWFMLGKYTFNGYTREQVERIKNETNNILHRREDNK